MSAKTPQVCRRINGRERLLDLNSSPTSWISRSLKSIVGLDANSSLVPVSKLERFPVLIFFGTLATVRKEHPFLDLPASMADEQHLCKVVPQTNNFVSLVCVGDGELGKPDNYYFGF